MLTLHTNYTLGSYQADRDDFLERRENLPLYNDPTAPSVPPHFDGGSSIAIGFGLDLLNNSIASINNWLANLGPLSFHDEQLINQAKALAIKNEATLIPIASQFELNLQSFSNAVTVLDAILATKEGELNQLLASRGIVLDQSRERAALVSLYFNGRPKYNAQGQVVSHNLIGPNLLNALANGNRAEAWYEIRYQTNRERITDRRVAGGIAIRRYAESDTFGLYENAPLTDAEAKSIFRMYTAHRDVIQTYESDSWNRKGARLLSLRYGETAA